MTTPATDPEPPTDRDHDTSWSANLETPGYAEDPDLVVDHALEAVRRTATGTHVNLVTHEAHGHPESYLHPALEAALDEDASVEFVDRCGCGGYVTRVRR
ncbi:MAG TPA: CGCGG family rSAM-modified RiPP protein [Halobacteriales archaeon]|nr:CGCGG family rSAM-modified RiPP protein [Halobacteriales archaeon]